MFYLRFRQKVRFAFGAAVALSLLGCYNSQATTISGSYSFTTSGFSADAPIAEMEFWIYVFVFSRFPTDLWTIAASSADLFEPII